jgi:two-component system chemotaxis response regulator CheY
MDSQGHRARVLVVDDDVDALNSISEILESEGFDTICAQDGQEAWKLMHEVPTPDLIVLDLMMPKMDGWTFRMHQRRDRKLSNIPVVVVSALASQPTDHEAEAILSKPLNIPKFLEVVKRGVLRHASSR